MSDILKWIFWFPVRETMRVFLRFLPYKTVYLLGNLMGTMAYYALAPHRHIIRDELRALLGDRATERELDGYTRLGFKLIFNNELDGMFFEDFTPERIKSVTRFEGMEHIDAALKDGKGAMIVLMHFGWHMHLIPAISHMGYRLCQVGDYTPHTIDEHKVSWFRKSLTKKMLENAERMPMTFLKAQDFLRPIYKALKENNLVLIALDGLVGKGHNEYDFMGRKIHLSSSPFRIAASTGAKIIPVFDVRQKDQTHAVHVYPAIDTSDEEAGMRKFVDIFEAEFKATPWNYGMYLLARRLRFDRFKDAPLFSEWNS